ncbi:hypothetical protein WA1_24630 [Scytonema hofmannii PCC 7110]|uniref:Novel STAND NTPase 1 domain-containing protein n=1 Tax=Scytonema hofmannii PCC 7110 TaxID=128403 RepID=A0A139X854_9CYAN|nr:AAA family ATPase [Scytonema hofmannii]KYC40813.1 hypothetical protein WA1_24630 [Scytonema hofmannii PCC 7110]
MSQQEHSEENLLPIAKPMIQQQVENSTLSGGVQAAIGNDNIQIQGDSNNVTINNTEILQISIDEIKTRKFIETSPYKGLKKFEPEDKDLFFGRDQFLQGLVDELEQTNLVLLLGASGSGKSSVVRAGLIPWLSQKHGTRLVNLIFTPDQDPFESLYASLLSKNTQQKAQIAREAKADTLTQVVTRLKQADDYWFILIDQFEELFTTSHSEKRDRFIASLVQIAKANVLKVKIMATMRADFLDKLSPYPALVKATNKHRPLIAEMQSDELRLAIEQPAAHHGVVFETGLVEEIIKDVQGQAGYLPLLQYTLNLLWETEVKTGSINDRTLNSSTYRKLGGVRGALQQRVDKIYEDLPAQEKIATQRIFLKLVDIGGDEDSGIEWKPVRRRALRSEFSVELEQDVLVKLINNNLLVSDRPKQSQQSTVEIAHETLLTSWTTLNNWIKTNRQAIALRNRLNDDVARWQASKAEDELWSGSKLEKIRELRKDVTFNQVLGGFSETANQFIDASLELRDRRKRRTTIVLTSFSAVAFTFAGVAAWQREISVSRELAANAKLQLAIDPEQSLQLATRAIDTYHTPEAEDILRKALFESRVRAKIQIPNYQHNNLIWTIAFTSDSKQVVATNMENGTVKVLNIDTLDGHTSLAKGKAFTNGDFVLVVNDNGRAEVRNFRTNQVQTLNEKLIEVTNAVFSSDGKFVLIGRGEKPGQIMNIVTGVVIILNKSTGNVVEASFSPDNQFLVSVSDDWKARLWNVKTGEFIRELPGNTSKESLGEVTVVQFSLNGNYIATACGFGAGCYLARGYDLDGDGIAEFDGTVRIWKKKGATFELFHELPTGDDRVYGLGFDSRSQLIATASGGKIAQVWNVSSGERISTFTGHSNWVWSAAFSPDSNFVVTSGSVETPLHRLWRCLTIVTMLQVRSANW